jgi:hypothetical protein
LATALTGFAKRSFEAADAIGDAAERAGVAVETLSRLKFAAEQNDVEFGALTIAIKRWQVTLSQAASGSKEAGQALGLLKLSASQLTGLNLEGQLQLIADQFQRIKNPADQTRVAVELFGRSGEQLVPLLKQGGSAIGELTKEADRLGITLDGRTVKSIDAADKALKKLKATISAFGSGVVGNVALAIMGPQDNVDAALLRLEDLIRRRDAILTGQVRVPGPARSSMLESLNAQIEGQKEALEILKRSEQLEAERNPLQIPVEFVPLDEVRTTARGKPLEGMQKLLQDFEEQTRGSLETANNELERTRLKLQELFESGAIGAEKMAERLRVATAKYNESIDIEPVQVSVERVQETLNAQQRAIQGFVGTVKEGLANLAMSGEITGKSILRFLLSALQSKVLMKAIEALGVAMSKALNKGAQGGNGGFWQSLIGGVVGAFSAGGGRTSGPRIVGEEGPELLLSNGNVMNRRQLAFAMGNGGGGNVSIGDTTIVVQGTGSPEATAQLVEARIQQNNRRQLEHINRLMANNGFGNLR